MQAHTRAIPLVMHQYIHRITQIVQDYRSRFPSDDEYLRYLPQQLARKDLHICNRKNFSGHLTASALLVDDARKSAFLIYHKFLQRWLQPGGHLDNMEDPVAGAVRECEEETGLKNLLLHPWHTDNENVPLDIDSHFIPNNPEKMEFSHFHHDFLYVFKLADDTETATEEAEKNALQIEEVTDCKWYHYDDLINEQCGKRLARAIKKLTD
ncbi:MAG: NUDIX domain-containing protein [Candidatus Obscuribacterales bacterium]|nr:NUDIX domain-containing protein [Candidatus Obscuribacterales bacterium]